MQYNIYRLYLIKIAKWFSLIMPIVVLFYNENGLHQFDIFLLQAIYSVAIVVLEIPSGYFADVLGRRFSLIIGAILGFVGFSIYSFSFGFWGFLAAEITLGIGQSLISGADSAMMYDSLSAQKREKLYLKFEGRITSIGNFAEALAGIAGGFLATYSLRTPYYFQALVAFIAIPAAFTLVEPIREKTITKLRFSDILGVFKIALIDKPKLRYNIIFSSIIGCATLSMAWFVQPYFKVIELPSTKHYGILWTLLNLSVGITSLLAYRIDKSLGKAKVVLLIAILISSFYILSGIYQSYWGISILFLFYFVRGFATPILKNYINQMTESNIRATVLSVRNFIIRLVFAGLSPLLGWLTDNYSLSFALKSGGIFFLFIGLIISVLLIKANRES